jgi:hypothetical protein
MPLYVPRRNVSIPTPAVGQYATTVSAASGSTSNTLGNGTLRVAPWIVESQMKIDRVVGDIATIGEAGSLLRVGIWADTGTCYPGTLLLDGGTIAGDSATVQQVTVSLTLAAGLYWIGGAVQSAPTTQPTVRTTTGWTPPVSLSLGSSLPGAGAGAHGYAQTSVTGAFGASFTGTVTASANAPRLLIRVA